jgi:hypothetical protein
MASGKKIFLGIAIGCGVIAMLGVGGCVAVGWWAKNKAEDKVAEMKAEMEKSPGGQAALEAMKEGATKGEGGLVGAMTGLAGASVGMTSAALAAQVLPSLPASEHAEANAVFKALTEKGARMTQADLEAYGKAMDRFNNATEPGRKARTDAMGKETDPAKQMQLAMDMMKVEPEHARQLVADLKAITDRL